MLVISEKVALNTHLSLCFSIYGKRFLGRGKNKFKRPVVGTDLVHFRNNKKTHVAGGKEIMVGGKFRDGGVKTY